MELQGKRVLVFGSGKSGIGASDLLAKVGAVPVIFDGNAEIDKEAVVHKTDGTYQVEVYAGELPKEVADSLDLVVLSPGVPTDLPVVKSFFYGQASGLVEPIAGVLGVFMAIAMRAVLPILLAFSAGAMIGVVSSELIPEACL